MTLTGFPRASPLNLAPILGVCFDSPGTLSACDTNAEMCNGGTAQPALGKGSGVESGAERNASGTHTPSIRKVR